MIQSEIRTYPANIAPTSDINHSGELNPKILTPLYGSRPSWEKDEKLFIQSVQLRLMNTL